MEKREFISAVSVFLKPKPGNVRFSEIKFHGTGLDEETANKLLDVTSNLEDDVEATIHITMETK